MKLIDFKIGKKLRTSNGRIFVIEPLERIVVSHLPCALPQLAVAFVCKAPVSEWHWPVNTSITMHSPGGKMLFGAEPTGSPNMLPGATPPWFNISFEVQNQITLEEVGEHFLKIVVKGYPDNAEQVMTRSFVVELVPNE